MTQEYIIVHNDMTRLWALYSYPQWTFRYESKEYKDVITALIAIRENERGA